VFKKENRINITSLIELYRYISILLTITIYILKGIYEGYGIPSMIFLTLCVIISAFLFNYLYKISILIESRLYLLLLMEIAGMLFLILYTGGLNSPFTWCFFNPLLIISAYVPARLKAPYLALSLLLLYTAGYFKENSIGVAQYLMSHSNIILSYLLIIILANILLYYSKIIKNNQDKLQKANNDLQQANSKLESYNKRIEGMIQDTIGMYDAVQALPVHSDIPDAVKIILDFAGRLSPLASAFFALKTGDGTSTVITSKPIGDDVLETLKGVIEANTARSNTSIITGKTGTDQIAVFTAVSKVLSYGAIGLVLPEAEYFRAKNEYDASILLYKQLSVIFFDKIKTDAISRELVIEDEQNRIADDIHDSVVQRLFAMSCFTYDILRKWDEISDEEKKSQIAMVMETIRSSLIDLRSTIYNLSSKKQQVNHFEESVTAYLAELERLSGVNIDSDIRGNFDSLLVGAKKALYRIITECVGNAIRHSKCENIRVELIVGESVTSLTISDDGIGFDYENVRQEKNGIGLYNIRSLVRMFNGKLNIHSGKQTGTVFEISFENPDIMKGHEEV
jgi:NarL family two-component system sensor histidine kinase LiaS